MPFTFSHPAAILPWLNRNKHFSSSGLIAGSLVPDFEGFIRMDLDGHFADTLPGVFLLDLPLAVLLLFVYHNLIREFLIAILPKYFACRLAFGTHFKWINYFKSHWFIVLISILTGIVTHLIWDDFTHYDGVVVNHFHGFFYQKIGTMSLFNVFQHGSSLIGAMTILTYFHKMPINASTKIPLAFQQQMWLKIIFYTLCFILCRTYFGFDVFGEIIVSIIACLLWSLVLVCLLYRTEFQKIKQKGFSNLVE
ncbi:DUF4184 family protein [Maribacter sp. CXY002]|uniref:DUF4184 family protein n=1 Tax=Maribacter luteocoastalis TaxID=3407671 RepID=UPI003B672C8B